MKKKKKKKTNIGIIIIIIILVLLSLMLSLYCYQMKHLETIVIKNQDEWNILSSQNYSSSGEYQGMLYEEDYKVPEMNTVLLSSLLVDYIVLHDDTFYLEDNKISNKAYEKTYTETELNNYVSKMIGPDYKIDIEDVYFGCSKSITKNNDKYIVTAGEPEACGTYSDKEEFYKVYVNDYKYDKDSIVIKLLVGYLKPQVDEQGVISSYDIYRVDRNEIIGKTNNISEFEQYKPNIDFDKYKVILKKASDGKYYFYSIKKDK